MSRNIKRMITIYNSYLQDYRNDLEYRVTRPPDPENTRALNRCILNIMDLRKRIRRLSDKL